MTGDVIKVYVINNHYNRDFHALWDDIIEQLKKSGRPVEIIRDAKISPADYIDLELYDCEILVEIDGMFKGICFADYHGPLSDFFSAGVRWPNNTPRTENDILLISHGKSPYTIWDADMLSKVKCKILDGIFLPQLPNIDFYVYRELRKHVTPIDKFAFMGNVNSLPRAVVKFLVPSEHFINLPAVNPDDYFRTIINYKVGLCLPGAAELCHRDVEFLAMGVPILKFEYMANLTPPLIPNYHYISIPRIDNHPFEGERLGEQPYADLYIKRFLEVKDDMEFLNFISKNAMEYYDTYLSPSVRLKYIFKLWELPFYE
jgi:hypothetical protein